MWRRLLPAAARRKRQLGEMVLPNPPEGVPDPADIPHRPPENRQTSGSQSTAASAGQFFGIIRTDCDDAATEGIMSQAELESIQGDRSRNLRTSGELTDTIAYTVTVNARM